MNTLDNNCLNTVKRDIALAQGETGYFDSAALMVLIFEIRELRKDIKELKNGQVPQQATDG